MDQNNLQSEINNLKERNQYLAKEKSRLSLIIDLYNSLTRVRGLDNIIDRLLDELDIMDVRLSNMRALVEEITSLKALSEILEIISQNIPKERD